MRLKHRKMWPGLDVERRSEVMMRFRRAPALSPLSVVLASICVSSAANAQDFSQVPLPFQQQQPGSTAVQAAQNAMNSQTPGGGSTGSQGSDEERYVSVRAGGDLGYASLEGENFLALTPAVLLRVWNVRLDIAAPLRFNLGSGFSLRQRDWDELRDFARVPRCLRLDLGNYARPADRYDPTCQAFEHSGPQSERLYFSTRLAPLWSVTLGHGTLMNSFRNSFDPDHPALGSNTEFELWDWMKANFIIDDVTKPRVTGGRVSFWPIQIFTGGNREYRWDNRPDEFEIGLTGVADLNAPLTVQSAFGRPIVNSQNTLQYNGRTIGAVAADAHYFYMFGYGDQSQRWKVALYSSVDYVRFLGINDMDMFNAAFRFVAINREEGWEVRLGGDYRNIGNRFIPGYFDANYSVNSQQFALTNATQSVLHDAALTTTKLQYALSRSDGRAHGFRAWASAQIPIPISRSQFSPMPVTLFYEDSELPASATLLFGIGPVQIDQLVAGAQFVRRNFAGISDLFSLDGTLIRVFGQLYLGPQDERRRNNPLSKVFLNLRYDRRWNLQDDGAFAVTNDFQFNLGFAAGID